MPSSTESWGIEVGANAIKAVHFQKTGSGVKVLDYDILPFKKILTTPDLDVDEAIRVGLDKFIERHPVTNASIVVSVPGHMVFSRFAKLPPVETKKIPDIVKFEAVQQIPFPINDVEWDHQTFQDEDNPEVEVGIFAITKDKVNPWLANFESVGMAAGAITLSPIAAFNAITYDLNLTEEDGTVVIMDVGTKATDLIVADQGRLWMRTIPIGGNHFTDALVKSFKLSFSKAEKLKREAPSSKYARQIFQAMRPTFVDLAQEIQKSLGFYQSMNREANITRIIGLGSTFRMSGLRTFLKQQLQVNVDRIDRYQRLEIDDNKVEDFADNSVVLTTAYGLAVQGLQLDTINCNLLPSHILRAQMYKQKSFWFAGASAVCIVAAVLAFIMMLVEQNAYNSGESSQIRRNAKNLVAKGQSNISAWNELKDNNDSRAQIESIETVTYYRNIYPGIIEDVDAGLKAMIGDADYIKSHYYEATTADSETEARNNGLALAKDLTIVPDERAVFFITELTTSYQAERDPSEPGRISIRISGYSTHADTVNLINTRFIPAVSASIDQLTKPYTVVDEPRISLSTSEIIGAVEEDASGGPSPGTPEQSGPDLIQQLDEGVVVTQRRLEIIWTIQIKEALAMEKALTEAEAEKNESSSSSSSSEE